jgi:hypothetical protein
MALDIDDLLKAHRDFYGQYHHHKEQMAYGATVLYLMGALWLAVQGPTFRRSNGWDDQLTLILLAGGLSGWVFVVWQLLKRKFAAEVVAACTNLLTRRLNSPGVDFKTDPVRVGEVFFPHSLVDEITQVRQDTGSWVSAIVTIVLMASWTLLAVLRLAAA